MSSYARREQVRTIRRYEFLIDTPIDQAQMRNAIAECHAEVGGNAETVEFDVEGSRIVMRFVVHHTEERGEGSPVAAPEASPEDVELDVSDLVDAASGDSDAFDIDDFLEDDDEEGAPVVPDVSAAPGGENDAPEDEDDGVDVAVDDNPFGELTEDAGPVDVPTFGDDESGSEDESDSGSDDFVFVASPDNELDDLVSDVADTTAPDKGSDGGSGDEGETRISAYDPPWTEKLHGGD